MIDAIELLRSREMQKAGKLITKLSLSNEELKFLIEIHQSLITYFETRGLYFGLITSLLKRELEQLKGFWRARGQICGEERNENQF